MFFIDELKIIGEFKRTGSTPFPNEIWTIIEEMLLEKHVSKRPALLYTISQSIIKSYCPFLMNRSQPTMVVTVHASALPRAAAIQRCAVCGHIFMAVFNSSHGLRFMDLRGRDCSCDEIS